MLSEVRSETHEGEKYVYPGLSFLFFPIRTYSNRYIITDQIMCLSALYKPRQSLASPLSLFTRLHEQVLRQGERQIVQVAFED